MFDSLSNTPEDSYEAVKYFQGADYSSKQLTFSEGDTAKVTTIVVYDATTSDEIINVAMAHMVIYVEEETLLVKEYYLFINNADRTYIGSARVVNKGGSSLSVTQVVPASVNSDCLMN
ncbi:hypothetical protein ACFLV0_04560 [Chloroflexota bacterium]